MLVRRLAKDACIFDGKNVRYNSWMDLKQILDTILNTQVSCLTQLADMDAQLHALQIVLMTVQPERTRQRVAEVLVQTFDEQRRVRQAALEQGLQRLALLRADVSKSVN